MEELYGRFSGAVWSNQHNTASVFGLGGIGSWLVNLIPSMFYSIDLYEEDTIESANIGSQNYFLSQIGSDKQFIAATYLNGKNVKEVNLQGWWQNEDFNTEVLFVCVDSIEVRKNIFEKFLKSKALLLVDGRMQAEYGEVRVVDINNNYSIETYRNSLFSEEEGNDPVCTNRATPHCGNLLSCLMVNAYTNWEAIRQGDDRDLFALTTYNMELMMMENKYSLYD